ncbi:MAG: ferredoxin [Bacteroidales bacterium]|nr:ferredoxin [Bacteroidales bacterium]
MVRITHHRNKCIGCFYCVEVAPNRWQMDEKDGKSTLIGGVDKKGVYYVQIHDFEYDENKEAENLCPVNIIRVEK